MRAKNVRPSLRQTVGRSVVVVLVNTIGLWLLALALAGLKIDDVGAALLGGVVVGVLNALVWPAVAFLMVPLSVLTLGVGAVLINALVVGLVLDELPGVHLDGLGAAVAVTVGLTIVTTVAARLLAIRDDAWFDEHMARRARRHAGHANSTHVAGMVIVQIDGLAEQVLRRALASGDVPTLQRWLREGSHELVGWETEWSSQTGVSQCGILHGSTNDMPAFRWFEKETGRLMVSNHPESAAEIERRHSDGAGLLAHDGSSYGNLFTGDAERAVLTMSVAGHVKEGRIGAGYGRYFARPSNAIESLLLAVVDFLRDRRATRNQRHRGVEPRIHRSVVDSLLRAFTTVISRDVCVNGVLGDIAEGRSVIYVDLLGFDEVSHHSGPERADTLGVLRDIDDQVGRIERALAWAPRPYHLVVLSDHGQTQGPPFEAQFGESLEQLIERLTGADASADRDSAAGRTESTAWLRSARRSEHPGLSQGTATVLGSGSLGLVYLPGPERRLTREEIDDRYPDLIPGLRSHAGIGFVMARSHEHGAMALGRNGHRLLDRAPNDPGAIAGDDPLAPFGESAAANVARVDRYEHVADLMINASYDPATEEIYAFEHQVGSHGGLGGPQTRPFLLRPVELPEPALPIERATMVYGVLKGWLVALGHPVEPGRSKPPEDADRGGPRRPSSNEDGA